MTSQPRIAGIILAAGRSTRMGELKQCLPFRGKTVLECVVDCALSVPLDPVVVVLGYRASEILPRIQDRQVKVVISDFEQGHSASIRAGLEGIGEEVDAALFLLGDQPRTSPRVIQRIIDAYAGSSAPIVLPYYQGRRGNPALFDRRLFPKMRRLSGDTGPRVLFREFAEEILPVPVDDPFIHEDIDTAGDYLQLVRSESGRSSD